MDTHTLPDSTGKTYTPAFFINTKTLFDSNILSEQFKNKISIFNVKTIEFH